MISTRHDLKRREEGTYVYIGMKASQAHMRGTYPGALRDRRDVQYSTGWPKPSIFVFPQDTTSFSVECLIDVSTRLLAVASSPVALGRSIGLDKAMTARSWAGSVFSH